MNFTVKTPESPAEFDSMWRLNHDVFARELGQHAARADGRLVDKFHGKNIYRVAWDGERVLGMVCAHMTPPFSVVGHFGETAAREIVPGVTAEIRLLALRPECRGNAAVPVRLFDSLFAELERRGAKKFVISGIAARRGLYESLGFRVVGPSVRDGASEFFPMAGTPDAIRARLRKIFDRFLRA